MWCSIVGPPDLGMVAAVELGVDLERLVVVAAPQVRAATAIGALVEGCDVVLLRLPLAMTRTEMLRLGCSSTSTSGARRAAFGDPRSRAMAWPEAPDVTVQVRSSVFFWHRKWKRTHCGASRRDRDDAPQSSEASRPARRALASGGDRRAPPCGARTRWTEMMAEGRSGAVGGVATAFHPESAQLTPRCVAVTVRQQCRHLATASCTVRTGR